MAAATFATAAATSARAKASATAHGFAAGAYRLLGRTGLTVSALGFGGYRVDDGTPQHREALEQALAGGVTLIDTSSNYTDGGSETLIGAALARQPALREGTVLVSKVGYVQGRNMALAQEAQRRGDPFPDMVEYHPQCWHCIHPRFLADQLGRSLERLGLSALDVYLLHNPEYFFSDWVHRTPGGDLSAARDTFYRRCTDAFAELERQAQQGRLAWYGVSSNTFGEAAGAPEFVSLERLLEAARAAARQVHGGAARFAVVQCPLNLFESGPALEANQSGGRTLLDVARAEGLGVLINRPLNAIQERRLIRLADRLAPRPDHAEQVHQALTDLAGLETDFSQRFRPAIAAQLAPDAGPREPFDWATQVRTVLPHLESMDGWLQLVQQQVYPQIQQALTATAQALQGTANLDPLERWTQAYAMALQNLSRAIQEHVADAEYGRALALREKLTALVPPSWTALSLSEMALRAAATVPGVTCVLNGMRRPEYVRDSLGALAGAPLDGAEGLAVLKGWR
jgi:aryl-alcohol dehydrogenase-like predicted oxidoreductase